MSATLHFNLQELIATLQKHPAALFAAKQCGKALNQSDFPLGKSARRRCRLVLAFANLFCLKTSLFCVFATLQNGVSLQVALRQALKPGLCKSAKTLCRFT